ncbi:TetR/AcrR family transcriptional regulator [Limnohabitans sp. 2KL-27]|jgi:AcrR family transcriptional regulator|uniref:TetR/AcrR family transcriptional regulator n=1 Tax=Limnohabitans sp. 2KL-27 TaxID=1100705 RepID=UPI000B2D3661|nr:TetR/AcrR family transcriptional regulator [Limnohabitans sp. 2KL-27]
MSTTTTRSPTRKLAAPGRKPGVRELAAQETQDSILRAATRIFAKHGFSGARVDQISKAAKSHDRMIYYYFGSKEGLYIAVLEDLYRRFNDAEARLKLNVEKPEEALVAVVSFMWDYYQRNPEFITLLNDENLHRGKHISKSLRAREYSSPAIQILESVLASGAQKKVFRKDLLGRDVYLMIAGLNYFYLSNRFTLSAFLGEKLENQDAMVHWQQFVIETVLRTVKT